MIYQSWRDVKKANTKPRTPEWEVYVPSSISGLCERGTSVDILVLINGTAIS
jgi:hypothetical protein